MTYFIFIIKSALEDFKNNKIRTFLTSLGILIGVASVILLTAFGLGLKVFIQQQFNNLGTNLVFIYPGSIVQGGKLHSGPGALGTIRFDEKDYLSLSKLQNAEEVFPVFTKSVSAKAEGKEEYGDIYATTYDVFPARNLNPLYGSLWEATDVVKRSKKAVVGPKIAEKLFGNEEDAVGKKVTLDTLNFTIVGVLESKGGGGFGGPDLDSMIYVPYKSVLSLNPDKKFLTLVVKVSDDTLIDKVKVEISDILNKRYKPDDYSIIKQTEIIDAISSIFSMLNIALIAIAGISLVVGGIGIMNIMYVSVIERIREIGIRRALGAQKQDILSMFLAEAVILSLLGGSLGIGLSTGIILIVQSIFPAYVDLNSILIAFGVSSFIGIVFGVFPAKKASDLSPIDAIRYE